MRARTLALLLCMTGCPKPAPTPEPPPGPGSGSGSGSGGGGGGLVPPTVAPELAVPDGNKLTLVAAAKGVQIYDCAPDASGAPAWKLHAPRAVLVDDSGAQVAIHFGGVDKALPPGPYWQASDGSPRRGCEVRVGTLQVLDQRPQPSEQPEAEGQ